MRRIKGNKKRIGGREEIKKKEDTYERVRYVEERIVLAKKVARVTDPSRSLSYCHATIWQWAKVL